MIVGQSFQSPITFHLNKYLKVDFSVLIYLLLQVFFWVLQRRYIHTTYVSLKAYNHVLEMFSPQIPARFYPGSLISLTIQHILIWKRNLLSQVAPHLCLLRDISVFSITSTFLFTHTHVHTSTLHTHTQRLQKTYLPFSLVNSSLCKWNTFVVFKTCLPPNPFKIKLLRT